MRMNTVIAIVSDTHRYVDQLLSERIERAGRHHLFHAFPGPAQSDRMTGQGLPEVVHLSNLSRCHNVIEDIPNFGRGIFVFDQFSR